MNKQEQLNELKEKIAQCKLPLQENAKNLVFGKGNPDASLLFCGEAPGQKEDEQGIPFVGSAGKELDKLLHSIGLSLDEVYIANILKYRPPENRNPNMEEIRTHTPHLIEQIKIIQPKVIATLGNFATKFILGECNPDKMKNIEGISQLHGKPKEMHVNGYACIIIPLYHPAAMLYNPNLRPALQEDFKIIQEVLKQK